MKLSVFLELIEAKAKAASIFPFAMGWLFSWYHFHQLNRLYTFLFFISMLLFNIAVDILNNYSDYTRHTATDHYKTKTNIIGREGLSLILIQRLLIFFLTTSFVIGLVLAWHIGWDVFFLGLLSFSIGIFYSWGPKPLNSLPVGELASGLTMGFLIPLIIIRINSHPLPFWQGQRVLSILLFSLPSVLLIGNVMLANNICDVEEDILNKRHTLVTYIGKKRGLHLFSSTLFIAYLAIILAVIYHLAPWTYALSLFSLPLVLKQYRCFMQKQIKEQTFICAVRILMMISLAQVITFGIGILL